MATEVGHVSQAVVSCPWGPDECPWEPSTSLKLTIVDEPLAHGEVAVRFTMSGDGYLSGVRLRLDGQSAGGELAVELRADGRSAYDGRLLARGRAAISALVDGADAVVPMDPVAPVMRLVDGASYWLRLYAVAEGTDSARVDVSASEPDNVGNGSVRTVACLTEPVTAKKRPTCKATALVLNGGDVAFVPVFSRVAPAGCFDMQRNGGESDVDCGGEGVCDVACAIGKRCRTDGDCDESVCRPVGEDAVSDTGCSTAMACVCKAKAAAAATCDDASDCESGRCTRACLAKGALGASCTADTDCLTGRCDESLGGGQCATKLAKDAVCTVDSDCVSGRCPSGACLEAVALAGACTTASDCASGRCSSGACAEKLALDATCAVAGDCLSGRCVGAKCAARLAAGASCSAAADCASGRCKDGLCAPAGTTGAGCAAAADCGSGLCGAQPSVCAAKLPAGDTCAADVDCQSARCASGKCAGKLGNAIACADNADCVSGRCASGKCEPATCGSGIADGGESDVDCGGTSCQARCASERLCVSSTDCVSGTVCRKVGETKRCATPLVAAATCTASTECADGLYCAVVGKAKVCAARLTSGTCAAVRDCADGYSCFPVGGVKSCAAVHTAGGSCTVAADCVSGLVCKKSGGMSTCASPVTSGNACASTAECTSGLVCGPKLTCVAAGDADAACKTSADCAGGLICRKSGTVLVCSTAVASQGACTASAECATGLVCGPVARKCLSAGLEGASCTSASDCSEGLSCRATATASVCAAPLAGGAVCKANAECATGYVCKKSGSSSVCAAAVLQDGSCSATSECATGLVCGPVAKKCLTAKSSGVSCTGHTDCSAGLVCLGTVRVCGSPLTAGSVCRESGECDSAAGLACLLPSGAASKVCASRRAKDSACALSTDCVDGLVCRGLKCADPVAAGAVCGASSDCASGFTCGVITRRCVAAKALDASCVGNDGCNTGSCRQGRCWTGATGEACSTTADCAAAYYCAAGLCAPRITKGNVCDAVDACAAGLACVGREGAERCFAPLPVGAACAAATHCGSNVCTDGVCVDGTLSDGLRNGDETDVDCGTSAAPCGPGKGCRFDAHCATGFVCRSSVCIADLGSACTAAKECASGFCAGRSSVYPPFIPGTSADCGVGKARSCVRGELCGADADCGASGVCSEGVCLTGCTTNGDCLTGQSCLSDVCRSPVGVACSAQAECSGTEGICARTGAGLVCSAKACRGHASCEDGVKNRSESDVDCGGVCADGRLKGTCAAGKACRFGDDCASGLCKSGKCLAPTCSDGVKNGNERGIDCGSGSAGCGKCPIGTSMAGADAAFCDSGIVSGGQCTRRSCSDGRNGDETDVDCGGAQCGPCVDGKLCRVAADCDSGVCVKSGATRTCAAPTGSDRVRNGDETDVDCGGSRTRKCAARQRCAVDADCASTATVTQTCSATGYCSPPTCGDTSKNGKETDIDCGGPFCWTRCEADNECRAGGDCSSGVCKRDPADKKYKCTEATSTDGLANGDETGVDCGCCAGATCASPAKCAVGAVCDSGDDCSSAVCTRGRCVRGTCGNGANESCGRSCAILCVETESCVGDVDCASGLCLASSCAEAAPGGCAIEGTSYAAYVVKSDDATKFCQPSRPWTWSTVTCGDGVMTGVEACDDGNTLDDDGCSNLCLAESVGDGIVQSGAGEQCDEGTGFNKNDALCTAAGTVARCGDNLVSPHEECDDGNRIAGDGCSPSCARETSCEMTVPSAFACAAPGSCRIASGVASCVCPAGYKANVGGTGCDKDPCASGQYQDGLVCAACPTGTRSAGDAVTWCESIDCQRGQYWDGVGLACVDCGAGQTSPGGGCQQSACTPCATGEVWAPAQKTCTACGSGYTSSGGADTTCDDVDECLVANGGCGGGNATKAACDNVPLGSYTCTCKVSDGWYGDGKSCIKPGEKAERTIASTLFRFRFVPSSAGYQRGKVAGDDDAAPGEEPAHTVVLARPLLVLQNELTQGQWKAVMSGANPSYFLGDELPVERVSWYDAIDFCNALTAADTVSGLTAAYTRSGTTVTRNASATGYRLPTEAEWEFAARATSTAKGPADLTTTSWYADTANKATHDADAAWAEDPDSSGKDRNDWNLFHMLGNVAEWTWDWSGGYTSGLKTDPTGPASGLYRVIRGGSWNSEAVDLRYSARGVLSPDVSSIKTVGLRPVCPQ